MWYIRILGQILQWYIQLLFFAYIGQFCISPGSKIVRQMHEALVRLGFCHDLFVKQKEGWSKANKKHKRWPKQLVKQIRWGIRMTFENAINATNWLFEHSMNVQKTCLETAQPNQERYALIGSVTKAGEQVWTNQRGRKTFWIWP